MTSPLIEIQSKETEGELCLSNSEVILNDIEALASKITLIEALVNKLPSVSLLWRSIKEEIQDLDNPRFQRLLALLFPNAGFQVYGIFRGLAESIERWQVSPYEGTLENSTNFDVVFSSIYMLGAQLDSLKEKVEQGIVPDDDISRYLQYSDILTQGVKVQVRNVVDNNAVDNNGSA